MDERDRRFYSWLAIVFGPLFAFGGLFAFNIVGAAMVWFGLTMLLAGIALKTPLPTTFILVGAGFILAGLVSYAAFFSP